jgi:hypothetical protein
VKFVGVDELHAAFLNESRTRGRCSVPRTGNPGISRKTSEIWGHPSFVKEREAETLKSSSAIS